MVFSFLLLLLLLDPASLHGVYAAKDHGGWGEAGPKAKLVDINFCGVERRESLTQEEFESDYYGIKPVILQQKGGFVDKEPWRKDNFLAKYGDAPMLTGNGHLIQVFSGTGYTIDRIQNFAEQLVTVERKGPKEGQHVYTFDRGTFLKNRTELRATVTVPQYLHYINEQLVDEEDRPDIRPSDPFYLALGSSGSGVSFHMHGEAWNTVVFGRKRWILFPPENTFPHIPGLSVNQFLRKVYPNIPKDLKPIQCVQEADELMYVPEGWRHATINIGPTLALASQTTEPRNPHLSRFMDAVRPQGKRSKGGPQGPGIPPELRGKKCSSKPGEGDNGDCNDPSMPSMPTGFGGPPPPGGMPPLPGGMPPPPGGMGGPPPPPGTFDASGPPPAGFDGPPPGFDGEGGPPTFDSHGPPPGFDPPPGGIGQDSEEHYDPVSDQMDQQFDAIRALEELISEHPYNNKENQDKRNYPSLAELYYNVGQLYEGVSERSKEPSKRKELQLLMLKSYKAASQVAPHHFQIVAKYAHKLYRTTDSPARAKKLGEHALSLLHGEKDGQLLEMMAEIYTKMDIPGAEELEAKNKKLRNTLNIFAADVEKLVQQKEYHTALDVVALWQSYNIWDEFPMQTGEQILQKIMRESVANYNKLTGQKTKVTDWVAAPWDSSPSGEMQDSTPAMDQFDPDNPEYQDSGMPQIQPPPPRAGGARGLFNRHDEL